MNPDHLFLGTQLQNMRDMAAKRRSGIGEKNSMAKLTEKQVKLIRKMYSIGRDDFYRNRLGKHLMKDLAKKFHVTKYCIYLIVHKINWSKTQ